MAYVAKATAIATGGAGRIYRVTTNAVICDGTGYDLALKTGVATLSNMEAIQFHPTGIFPAGILVTEGCRGDGGLLRDVDGYRFMPDVEPEKKELASRDVVSRRMEERIAMGKGVKTKYGEHLWLDITLLGEHHIKHKLREVYEICHYFLGVDPTKEWVPVRPAQHYTMGGVRTKPSGESETLKGLFAAGEAACWDMHGFNRLGGNSVAETVVAGMIVGEYIADFCDKAENGIDIPNANTIIVNNAQNFGLSDLHQLRGRVGRGSQRGYCYLLSPGDELLTPDARRRLRAIEEFSDLGSGFNIAMQDLDIRGAGNLLGAEQSGFIADIGFETYQKIMQEAIAELRSEGLEMPGMSDAEQGVVDKMSYISDSVIEIDVEAELPDSYVQQPAEKLRLYRELDTARNEEMLKSFEAKMIDRFGPLPRPAAELLNVVRLRWEAVRLGMERVKVKNGLMIVHFVGDDDSPYYKSDTFMELLRKVTQRPDRFVLKQHNNRLAMTVRGIKDVAAGYEVLKSL